MSEPTKPEEILTHVSERGRADSREPTTRQKPYVSGTRNSLSVRAAEGRCEARQKQVISEGEHQRDGI